MKPPQPRYAFTVISPTAAGLEVVLEAKPWAAIRSAANWVLFLAFVCLGIGLIDLRTAWIVGLLLSPVALISYLDVSRRAQSVSVEGMFVRGEYTKNPLFNTRSQWELPRDLIHRVEYYHHGSNPFYGAICLACDGAFAPRKRVLTLQVAKERREETAHLIAEKLDVACAEIGIDEIKVAS